MSSGFKVDGPNKPDNQTPACTHQATNAHANCAKISQLICVPGEPQVCSITASLCTSTHPILLLLLVLPLPRRPSRHPTPRCPLRPWPRPVLPAAPASRAGVVLPLLLRIVCQPQAHVAVWIEPEAGAAPCTRPHVAALNQVVSPQHQPPHRHAGQQGWAGEAVHDGHHVGGPTLGAQPGGGVAVLLPELALPAAAGGPGGQQRGVCWGGTTWMRLLAALLLLLLLLLLLRTVRWLAAGRPRGWAGRARHSAAAAAAAIGGGFERRRLRRWLLLLLLLLLLLRSVAAACPAADKAIRVLQ